MLIRNELEVMLGSITKKMEDLDRIVSDTRRLTDLENRVDDNGTYA